jgi:hypothetical protein
MANPTLKPEKGSSAANAGNASRELKITAAMFFSFVKILEEEECLSSV